MRSHLANYACGLCLLGAAATSSAQTTWNYQIADAGGGTSLLTWNVSGSLATPPGAVRVTPDPSLAVLISAPGIYADSYAATGASQPIPTPDGSYFQYDASMVYAPILSYDAYNAPDSGNDRFGLLATLLPPGGAGITFLYHPGTQSALIPIDFSSFNPGTYQSEQAGFGTPLTVILTVTAVPEPSTLALVTVAALSGLQLFNRGKRRPRSAAGF